jgi:ribonuclease E
MPKRMLIDASHPEETRVVVLDGQRVEEFDFEAASKRPLKGNIYLAKVTRVEPSLQAAFVEYGGNRQGFLAFSEIHPDYYQIPVADRMALLAEQEAVARQRQEDDIESFEITSSKKRDRTPRNDATNIDDIADRDQEFESTDSIADEISLHEDVHESAVDSTAENEESDSREHGDIVGDQFEPGDTDGPPNEDPQSNSNQVDEPPADTASGGTESAPQFSVDAMDSEIPPADASDGQTGPAQPLQTKRPSQRWMRRRHYKIQEVIKRRQIILVQVVKEERGNKGAALTTYLSLAGRYCVLMPNTPRGGGISRKITNANDRKRLKSAAQALELPEGMGLIIRTAGENRTKVEIKRDYEYLLRLWDTIRELTLKSNAPACVYEEGDLIKRAIRDLYNKDVSEIVVEGEDGYRNAKDFMRMLMPSHAKNVKQYKEPIPLFQRHHIEAQLDAMFSPTVTLKSGGYIVINQAEALVAIDVNSGRATREHSIEETATKTNLEAADEIGRQLRLRDLAGLIVIDFIDMEDSRNDRAVEKRLQNSIKSDRARIQLGKISQFGLLEMSRQRLRAGVIAGSTVPCPQCGGQGIVRSVESTSLRVLRGLEEEAQRQRSEGLIVRVATDVTIYTLNQKRRELARLENDYDIAITFEPKEGLRAGDFEIDRIGQRDPGSRPKPALAVEAPPEIEAEPLPESNEESETEFLVPTAPEEKVPETQQAQTGEGGGRRRRRRRRRGGRDRSFQGEQYRDQPTPPQSSVSDVKPQELHGTQVVVDSLSIPGEGAGHDSTQFRGEMTQGEQLGLSGEGRRRRRRRRRGRRGGGHDRENVGSEQHVDTGATPVAAFEDRYGRYDEVDTTPRVAEPQELTKAEPQRGPEAVPNAASTPVWSLEADKAEHRQEEATGKPPVAVAATEPTRPSETSAQPAKRGWWQRAFRSD